MLRLPFAEEPTTGIPPIPDTRCLDGLAGRLDGLSYRWNGRVLSFRKRGVPGHPDAVRGELSFDDQGRPRLRWGTLGMWMNASLELVVIVAVALIHLHGEEELASALAVFNLAVAAWYGLRAHSSLEQALGVLGAELQKRSSLRVHGQADPT